MAQKTTEKQPRNTQKNGPKTAQEMAQKTAQKIFPKTHKSKKKYLANPKIQNMSSTNPKKSRRQIQKKVFRKSKKIRKIQKTLSTNPKNIVVGKSQKMVINLKDFVDKSENFPGQI